MNDANACPSGPILVAVGPDARTLRLVHAGFRMAQERGVSWVAFHVCVVGQETAEEEGQARVWLQEAQELGAEVSWIRAGNLVSGFAEQVKRHQPSLLLVGEDRFKGFWARLEHTSAKERVRRDALVRVVTVPLDAPGPGRKRLRSLADGLGMLAAMAMLLAICTILAHALEAVMGFPAIPAVYAAGTAFMRHRWGRGASLPALLLALTAYLLFFAEPRFSLAFTDGPKLAYFLGTLGVTQVLVALLGQLRTETRQGRRREAETILLLLLGRALGRCTTLPEAAEVLGQRARSFFQAEAWLLIQHGTSWEVLPARDEPPGPPAIPGEAFGRTALKEDPLEPVFLDGYTFLSLASTRGQEGLLCLRTQDRAAFPPDAWSSLQAFAVQGALALERIRSLEAAQQARTDQETERLRSSLLSAISHDLRTPLAAIQGAASSLLLAADTFPENTRQDLLSMIHDESQRLARLLSNLLDLTRLESGVIRARKEWQPLDEVVGAALRQMESGGQPVQVAVDLPGDQPLVPLDAVLSEQLLVNLLTNARRHAPGSPVLLKAWLTADTLELAVSDQGPGIPEAFRERVFDTFFCLPGTEGGVGLGLAICEAIARAHGGRIWVDPEVAQGTTFRISLPREGEPPSLPAEPCP